MDYEYPDGVVEIVRSVRQEIKDGRTIGRYANPNKNGAYKIIDLIRSRRLPKNLGLGERNETEKIEYDATRQNIDAIEWAARQYFLLLLNDCERFKEMFQDHCKCEPPKSE